jgi:NAD(P)-dependent dehydrogenase (short-subunit alcohol dehydrogenase family)
VHVPVKLDGAVAVVTGASSGIGESTARALASRGAQGNLVSQKSVAPKYDRRREFLDGMRKRGSGHIA